MIHRKLIRAAHEALAARADATRAPQMRAYMKSAMPYLGVGAVPLRAACKEVFRRIELRDAEEWRHTCIEMWGGAKHREVRYCAIMRQS